MPVAISSGGYLPCSDFSLFVGVAQGAAGPGAPITVMQSGVLSLPSFSFAIGQPVFVSLNGVWSQIPSTLMPSIFAGIAISATSVLLNFSKGRQSYKSTNVAGPVSYLTTAFSSVDITLSGAAVIALTPGNANTTDFTLVVRPSGQTFSISGAVLPANFVQNPAVAFNRFVFFWDTVSSQWFAVSSY